MKSRPPAFVAIQPKALKWVDMPTPRSDTWTALEAAYSGKLQQVDGEASVRFARIISENGEPTHFIKIVSSKETEIETQRMAIGMAEALHVRGCHVPQTAGPLRRLDDDRVALILNWLDGRHVDVDLINFEHLGRAIGRLHVGASDFGGTFGVTKRTQSRLDHFKSGIQLSSSQNVWRGHRYEVFALARQNDFLNSLPMMQAEAVPIHADLNPGNMLIDAKGDIIFLDFEDMAHSELWPGLDVAKILERLILPYREDRGADWANVALDDLLRGYQSVYPERVFERNQLIQSLIWHMGLAVSIITMHWDVSSPNTSAELKKFAKLHTFLLEFSDDLGGPKSP